MRRKRAIWGGLLKLVCTALLLVAGNLSFAQEQVGHFKVKNNTMYIALSKNLSTTTIDSFILKYNLGDIGLKRFLLSGNDDSLALLGWFVDDSKPGMYVITKPLEQAKEILEEPCNVIFSPVPTPDDWRVVGGNRVVYGQNDFKNSAGFRRENDIIYFYLNNFSKAKYVRLAGNFTNWQHSAFPMTRTADGWEAAVKLKPGKYYYKFIINEGHWITDPDNNITENDGRGNENSVYFVTNEKFELKGYTDARKVFVAGNFNNWAKNKLPMQRTKNGWATEMYLEPGTHTYSFFVDGVEVSADKKKDKVKKSWVSIGNSYHFILNGYRDAKKVSVAGNFNDWNKDELYMERTDSGWKLSYVLGPGNYQYKFIVDGEWITDPSNPAIIKDTKGNRNSFLIIGANYEFRLKGYPGAREVFLAGDFNEWSPVGLPMKRKDGEWVCSVYLAPGKHLYKFVVDGQWIRDPANKNWEENRYGSGNSVIWIEKEV